MKPRRKFAALKGNKIFPIGEQKNGEKGLPPRPSPVMGRMKKHAGWLGNEVIEECFLRDTSWLR